MTSTLPPRRSEVAAPRPPPLLALGIATSPLLLSVGLVMIGLGLVQSLLGVRGTAEGFSTATLGVLMSAYYGGFLVGSFVTPRLVASVGHIRTFAALAATASAAHLVHGVFVDPVSWFPLRVIAGSCTAGVMVVAESWLNGRSTRATRGRLLALYMLVMFAGLATGQLLLNLADPQEMGLFVLVSVVVSLAVVPVSLSRQPGPAEAGGVGGVRLGDVMRAAPVAMVGSFLSGMGNGALFGLGAVFAVRIGLSVAEVSGFMAAAMVGPLLAQMPLGWLSDRADRRALMGAMATMATVIAAVAVGAAEPGRVPALLVLAGLLGATTYAIYPLSAAHLGDRISPHHLVDAGAKLVAANGVGAMLGPVAVATIMRFTEPEAFLWHQAGLHAVLVVYVLYRLSKFAPVEVHGDYAPLPSGTTPALIGLSPTAEIPGTDSRMVSLPTGVTLRVNERGVGEPIVLVHDLAGSSRGWQHQLRSLSARGHRVVAYDLRGHGESALADRYRLADHVDDLGALLAHLGTGPVHLAGVGGGAAIALAATAAHPAMVRSLVLAGCADSLVPERGPASLGRWAEQAGERFLARTFGWNTAARRVARSQYDPNVHPHRFALFRDEMVLADPAAVLDGHRQLRRWVPPPAPPLPTLVVLGERDWSVTPGRVAALRRRFPEARVEVMPSGGRHPQLDDPHGFDALVLGVVALAEVA